MFFHKKVVPGLAIVSYLVGDKKSGKAVVIDPVRDIDEYVDVAEKNNLTITDIVETHVHADFVCGSKALKQRLKGAPTIHCSGMGGKEWNPRYADRLVSEGNEVVLGEIRLRAVHTPGHTPEHIMWELYDDARSSEVPSMLFTGDFLFVGDVGRPDLLGKEQQKILIRQLYKSVFEILARYPDFVEIYPTHVSGSLCGKAISGRESSTLGYERLFNPSLQKMPEEQWCEKLMRFMPPPPPYFKRMKKVNAEGPEVIDNPMEMLKALSPQELEQMDTSKISIIDTRTKESFAALHIEGSYNITYAPNLPTYAGCFLPYDKPIVLICDEKGVVPKVVTLLMSVGYDSIIGYLKGGIAAWEEAGQEVAHTETITVQQLSERLKGLDAPVVVDVRADAEWASGHIEGAIHAPITAISDSLDSIPKGCAIATLCRSGNRSSVAASFLKSQGFSDISNVAGGMAAWESEGLPTVE